MFILICMMSLDSLAGMFSQRSGIQQSMGNTIMSTIISFLVMGQGLGNMLSGGNSDGGGGGIGNIQSMLSGLGGLNRDHELVREVSKKQEYKIHNKPDRYHSTRDRWYLMNNLKIIHRGCNLYWLVLWVAAEVERPK